MKDGRGKLIGIGGGKTRSILTKEEIEQIKEITQETSSDFNLVKR